MTGELTLDPFDPQQTHRIWEVAQRFQREAPVAQLDNGFVLVSPHRDVQQVLLNNQLFANAGGFRPNGLFVPLEDRTLGELDPPEHNHIRRLAVGAASAPSTVEAIRPFARDTSRLLLRALLDRGTGDLIRDFSVPLTNRVISKLLGVPLEHADWLAEQAEAVLASDMPVTNSTPRGFGYEQAFPELTGFIDGLIRARTEGGGRTEDAITRIIETADSFSPAPHKIIRMVLTQLLLGGASTTRDFIGHLCLTLIERPELHEAIAVDPSLVPVAVEEGLRLAPPVLFLIRTCKQPVELRGVGIEPGQRVIAAVAIANRDPTVYDAPDAFRLDRPSPAPHLSFGYGAHACVGSALARMEIQSALEAFVALVKPGDLAIRPGFTLRHMPTPFLYGPVSVDVERSRATVQL